MNREESMKVKKGKKSFTKNFAACLRFCNSCCSAAARISSAFGSRSIKPR